MSDLASLDKTEIDVLQEYIPLQREQVSELLEHQAKLLALHIAQSFMPDFAQHDLCRAPRFGKSNKLMLDAEMSSAEVDLGDVTNARRRVCCHTALPSGIPPAYKTVVDLGMAEANYVDALMTASNGAHILTLAGMMSTGHPTADANHKAEKKTSDTSTSNTSISDAPPDIDTLMLGVVIDPEDTGKMAHPNIGRFEDDSRSLITAQAIRHLLQVCDMFCQLLPTLRQSAEYNALRHQARIIGYQAIRAGAERMAILGHLFEARHINSLIPEGGIPQDITAEELLAPVADFIAYADDQISQHIDIDQKQSARIEALLTKRLEQINMRSLIRPEAPQQEEGLREKLRARIRSAQ